MPVNGLHAWIESARTAVQYLRAQRADRAGGPVRPASTVPAVQADRTGLRGMERTQDMDAVEAKGRVLDRYV